MFGRHKVAAAVGAVGAAAPYGGGPRARFVA